MDFNTAWNIIENDDYGEEVLSEEERDFLHTEALEYLVKSYLPDLDEYLAGGNVDTANLMASSYNLACDYRDKGYYEYALKYYEIGVALREPLSYEQAGLLYYYGLGTETNYEKAFNYLNEADKKGWDNGSYILADMYRYGQYVERDEIRYKEIIQSLANHYGRNENWMNCAAEVAYRLAGIWLEEGKKEAAYALLCRAESLIKKRLVKSGRAVTFQPDIDLLLDIQDRMFGDKPDAFELLSLSDIFFIEKYGLTGRLNFDYDDQNYTILLCNESDGTTSVFFEGEWFRSCSDFFDRAEIDGVKLREL